MLMSETFFPINDLLRRKLQTGLTVFSLTICVAATLFLLLFSDQIGFGISSVAKNTLTRGISSSFSQFLFFTGGLFFVIGAIVVSFIVFLLMAQRTKDFGLMKATGCPNSLVFGYFFTELLSVTLVSCILGVIIGLATDYAVINMGVFEVYNKIPNFWFIPLVFVTFFVFTLIFGAKPIFTAARMSPIKAISPIQYYGLGKGTQLKPLAKQGLIIRMATRSLFRRKSATLRIIVFLSAVFVLLTISIAGGIIASDTTSSWVQKATGNNIVLIAHADMVTQYVQLLTTFSGTKVSPDFNYVNNKYALPDQLISAINQTPGVAIVEKRLILQGIIQEVSGFMTDPYTKSTVTIGDSRYGSSLIVGLDRGTHVSEPFTTGFFLNLSSGLDAVVGDSVAQTVYASVSGYIGYKKENLIGDALREGVKIGNTTFTIRGICLDPINNGNVTYVPLELLQNLSSNNSTNILLVKFDDSVEFDAALSQVKDKVAAINADFTVISLNEAENQNVAFLKSLWTVVMFLPAFALAAAIICLINFFMITIEEQHQEFAILRATGGKPNSIFSIMAIQSLVVLFSSFAVGVSIGTIMTIFILTANPVLSVFTVVTICGWLLTAVLLMFLLSLIPALRFSKKPLIEIMS